MRTVTISPGFTEAERPQVAGLYWQAFSGKLGPVMRPEHRALTFIASVLDPEFALCARDADGTLLGVAGFKTASGALVDGGLRDMAHIYGWAGALWRGTALSLLERDTVTDTLLMDGIFVAPAARGLGVGTMLLRAIKREAVDLGLSGVRLDVIDTNPRARALYEREGFVAGEIEHLGPLRHIFGFSSATKMVCPVTL